MSSELLEESNSRFLTEAKEAVAFVLLELECMDVPTHPPEPSSHQEISDRQICPFPRCHALTALAVDPSLFGQSFMVLLLGGLCKDISALCVSTAKLSNLAVYCVVHLCQCCVRTSSPPQEQCWETSQRGVKKQWVDEVGERKRAS